MSTSSRTSLAQVTELVALGRYEVAIELISEMLQTSSDLILKRQLSDLYIANEQPSEAAGMLVALADDYAREGQSAKAIAALKKAQFLDPKRDDLDGRLARLLKEDHPATGAAGVSDAALDMALYRASAPALPRTARPAEPRAEVLEEKETNLGATPLFAGFDADELSVVIAGLHLQTFAPGDVIVSEGEAGDSLYIVTSGTVKAFVKDQAGHNHRVRQMPEGSFFGEVSILKGLNRTATIVAASPCELLELDRKTLDAITETHPRVRTVLETFCGARMGSAAESLVRRSDANLKVIVRADVPQPTADRS